MALAALSAIPEAKAQYLFPGNGGGYLIPNLGSNEDDYSAWDVFYSPYGTPNYPDFSAPYGIYQLASQAGVTPPTNSSPGNPGAYWDSRNPTITQIGTNTAFIIGPATQGNIYSYSNPLSYQVSDSTPYSDGLVLFQFQTEGTVANFSSIQLQYTNASGQLISLSPSQYLTEYQSASVSGQGFSVTNRTAVEWNLAGLDINSYNIIFASSAPSMSLQTANMDTSPVYVSTVPEARTWTATGSGVWSNGSNWAEGTSSVENGNVLFNQTGDANITLDANHTVGQITFETPGTVTITSPVGFTLTANTGISTGSNATGNYIVNANYVFGDYNVCDIASGTVQLNGTVSGDAGFFKQGEGTLELNGNNTFTGNVGVEGGTLVMNGTNVYSEGTSVIWGKLVIAGNALNGMPGALGNDISTISLGADSELYAYQDVTDPAAIVIDGDYTVARNILMAGGTFEKILGAENTSLGATFSGAIDLGTSTDVHLNSANAGDQVIFRNGITDGASGGTVAIDGQGTVIYSGSAVYSYANSSNIMSGTLMVDHGSSLISSGNVTVLASAGLQINGTLAGSGALNVNGTLSGTGTVSRPFSIGTGAKLSPGRGNPGVLNTVSETWASGGSYLWQIDDVHGTGGSDPGWDFLNIAGTLSLGSSSEAPFKLDIQSYTLGGVTGLLYDFDPNQDYSWKIATASNGISGFEAGSIQVDTTGFSNVTSGSFSVVENGDSLYVDYQPVPEPSTVMSLFAGGAMLLSLRLRTARRRRKPASK